MAVCTYCSGDIAENGSCRNCGSPSGLDPAAIGEAPPSPLPALADARAQLEKALHALAAAAGEQIEGEAAALGAVALEGLLSGYQVDLAPLLGPPTSIGTFSVRRRTSGLCRACLTPLELSVRLLMRATAERPARFVAGDLAAAIDALGHRVITPSGLADQLASLLVDIAGAAEVEVDVDVLRSCLGCGDADGTVRVARRSSDGVHGAPVPPHA